jgi:SAM-dependent methyltransferase
MPLETSQLQRVHFNRIAGRYREARSGGNHLVLRDLIWSLALSGAPLPTERRLRVLEPMCGYADGYEILAKYLVCPPDYTGFDFSDRIVADLRSQRPDLDIIQADVATYRPETSSTDIVVLIGGLHHVPDRAREVVMTMARALVPGGLFISFEPTNGNRLFRVIRERIYSRNDLFEADTERAFALGDYMSMFREAGLQCVDCVFPGLLSYVLYYNPDAFPALNVGGPSVVRSIFALERPFMRSRLASIFSFATLSIWRRSGQSTDRRGR